MVKIYCPHCGKEFEITPKIDSVIKDLKEGIFGLEALDVLVVRFNKTVIEHKCWLEE